MSAMFKSPLAIERKVAWRDLVTLGPESDGFWARVRATQAVFMMRYLAFNVVVAVGNAAVVLAAFGAVATPVVLLLWLVVQLLTIAVWIGRRVADARAGREPASTPAAMRRTLLEMLLCGAAWGMLFADLLPRVPADDGMLIVAMTMAATAVTAFTTAIYPLGALALSLPVVVGSAIGFAGRDWGEHWMVGIVFACFMIVIVRGNILTTFAFLARIKTQDELAEQEEMVRLLLNEFDTNGSEWLFEVDERGALLLISSRFTEVTGLPAAAVVGRHWTEIMGSSGVPRELRRLIDAGQPFRDMPLCVEVAGEPRWWSVSGTPKLGPDGAVTGYRGVGRDVTERHRAAERIHQLASFDTLTGLANRRLVHKALADGLSGVGGVALLFLDLDRFKAVNDSMGHGAGDTLLAEVGRRLAAVVEAHGPAGALVGRLGGDEFAIVLPCASAEAGAALGEAAIAALSEPYRIAGKPAVIGASAGLAAGPADGATVEALMRSADLALYEAKGRGRGHVRAFDRTLHAAAEDRRSLEVDLKAAAGTAQFRLYYQPIVDTRDERILGFEALLRWHHPERGNIPPAVFIPLAEETGLIGQLGRRVLEEAVRAASQWPRALRVAVNVSPRQFDDPDFVEHVRAILARHRFPAERLELELTEGIFLDDRPQTEAMLGQLRALGVGIALDDFGTGYSSLGYLRRDSIQRIKIDRSFVAAGAAQGGQSMAIIQAIVSLAERLGLETVAEGTETRAEFEMMRRMGCVAAQGYYFGRPMPIEDVRRLIERQRQRVTIGPRPPAPSPAEANAQSPAAEEPTSPPARSAHREPLRA